MKDRKGLIAVLLAALVALAALFVWQPWRQEAPGEQVGSDNGEAGVTSAMTSPRTINEGTVFAEGSLSPLRDAVLAAESGGLVQDVAVVEGDTVVSGEALVQLDSRDAEVGVRQAQAGLAQGHLARGDRQHRRLVRRFGQRLQEHRQADHGQPPAGEHRALHVETVTPLSPSRPSSS